MESEVVVKNLVTDNQLIVLLKSLQTTITNSYVPVKPDGNARPLGKSDFQDFVPLLESNLGEITVNVNKLADMMRGDNVPVDCLSNFGNDFVVPLVLLCGEHSKNALWSSDKTVRVADQIVEVLCKLCGRDGLGDILLETFSVGGKKFGALLRTCLVCLRPKLLKDSWKTFPAAVTCYQWILFQVRAPHLSDYLSVVLPTALILVDDFETENQLYGISCVRHIVENVTRAELNWHGEGDVVFEALQRVLHGREAALVRPLVACLVPVLDKLEGGHLTTRADHSWCRYDDVLEVVLRNMELESRSALRGAYIDTLPRLLEAAGVGVVRWSKRLLRVLQDYAEVAGHAEQETAVATLQALKTYMTLASPRLHSHAAVIFSMLLRLLYDVTMPTQTRDSKQVQLLVKSVEDCLRVLVQSAPHQANLIAADVKTQARFNETFAAVVDSVFPPLCS